MKREYLIQKPSYMIFFLMFFIVLVFSLTLILFDYTVPESNRTPTTLVSTGTMISIGFLIFIMGFPGWLLSNDNKKFYVNTDSGRFNVLVYKWVSGLFTLLVGFVLYMIVAEVQKFAFRDLISGDAMNADFIFARIPYAMLFPVVLYSGKLLFTHSVLRQYINKTVVVLISIVVFLLSIGSLWVFLISTFASDEIPSIYVTNAKLLITSFIVISFMIDIYYIRFGEVYD